MDDLDLGQTLRGFTAGQKVFGRYTLTRLLGRGGMGVVWLAQDGELDQDVALKFLPEVVMGDRAAIDDLRRETRRARELTHPHIVRIHDFVRDARLAAISMEYVAGDSLANLRLDHPARVFETAELSPWVKQLCEALEYAHTKARIVHRDLKPANLMVDAQGDLKVADFGISATLSDTATRASKQAGSSGTPVYMSPQQMMGDKPSPTDDIYSLGATLYELLSGKPPFYTGNVLLQVQNKVPPTLAERRAELGVENAGPIPAAWESTIAACLAKDPGQRPQSVADVFGRLSGESSAAERRSREASPPPVLAPSTGATSSTPSAPRPRSRLPLVFGLAAAVALAGATGWYYGIEQPAQRRVAEEQRQAEVARLEEPRRVEQARQAEMARLEAARQEAERAQKAAEERAAVAARERDEQARLAREAAAKEEQERQAAEQAANEQARRVAAERERSSSAASREGGSQSASSAPSGRAMTIPGLNLELMPIPAGSFAMGSTNGMSDEQPVTQVTITQPYWLGKTEVTQGQYEAVMGSNPSIFKGADRPVERVSWEDAMQFCRKLTERERSAGHLPEGYEYKLPTEAQWEYACRAGTTGDYAGDLNSMAWYDDNSGKTTHPVAQKQANAWGLYDMHGNVWEWCSDWYAGKLPGGSVRDPTGPASGSDRVYRGGGWGGVARYCRSAFRIRGIPGYRGLHLGFRLALAPQVSR